MNAWMEKEGHVNQQLREMFPITHMGTPVRSDFVGRSSPATFTDSIQSQLSHSSAQHTVRPNSELGEQLPLHRWTNNFSEDRNRSQVPNHASLDVPQVPIRTAGRFSISPAQQGNSQRSHTMVHGSVDNIQNPWNALFSAKPYKNPEGPCPNNCTVRGGNSFNQLRSWSGCNNLPHQWPSEEGFCHRPKIPFRHCKNRSQTDLPLSVSTEPIQPIQPLPTPSQVTEGSGGVGDIPGTSDHLTSQHLLIITPNIQNTRSRHIEMIQQRISDRAERTNGVLDLADRRTSQVLIDAAIDLLLLDHRHFIHTPHIDILTTAMRYHRIDPDSRDNVDVLRQAVQRILKDLKSDERVNADDKVKENFKRQYNVLNLLFNVLEISFYKTEEERIKRELKEALSKFYRPGAESLYRAQFTVGAGVGVSGGVAGATAGMDIGFSLHDWLVTTDTAKVLIQKKKGLVAGLSLTAKALAGMVKLKIRGGAFYGVMKGKLYNSLEEFIDDNWLDILGFHHLSPSLTLHQFLKRNLPAENTKKVAKLVLQLEEAFSSLNLTNHAFTLGEVIPKSLHPIGILRGVFETQGDVYVAGGISSATGGSSSFLTASAGASVSYFNWENIYTRYMPISEDLPTFNSDAINIRVSDLPPNILNLIRLHYPNDITCTQPERDGSLCVRGLMVRLRNLAELYGARDQRGAAVTKEQKQKNPEEKNPEEKNPEEKRANARPVEKSSESSPTQADSPLGSGGEYRRSILVRISHFYLQLIKENYNQFQQARRAYIEDKDSPYIKQLLRDRNARNMGELQHRMYIAIQWLIQQYQTLNGDSEEQSFSKWSKEIEREMLSNQFNLSNSQYRREMMASYEKPGKTTWKTISLRFQFLCFEVMGLLRFITDSGHCNPDSDGDYLLLALRLTATGNTNIASSQFQSEGFFETVRDMLSRQIEGEVDVLLDPSVTDGLTIQASAHFKVEFFFVKVVDQNGKKHYVLQYIRNYRGHEEALRAGFKLPSEFGASFTLSAVTDTLNYEVLGERWGTDTSTYLYGLAHGLMMADRREDLLNLLLNKSQNKSMIQMILNIMNPDKNIHKEFIERIAQIFPNINHQALFAGDQDLHLSVPSELEHLTPEEWMKTFRKTLFDSNDSEHESIENSPAQWVTAFRTLEQAYHNYRTVEEMTPTQSTHELLQSPQLFYAILALCHFMRKDFQDYLKQLGKGYHHTK